jgi:hypothetical protein
MVLVLAPLQGQPNEVLEINAVSQSTQLCIAVDSASLPVSVNTDQVANVSLVPGATCSSALNQLQADTTALAAVVSALDTDDIANVSTVAGASCSDALETLAALIVATASAPGYTARFGYVHASSAKIGTSFAGVTLQAAVTWNTPTDVPPGNNFQWHLWPGTGGAVGGKAGNTGSALNVHGAPSAGGAHRQFSCSRADVIAALPLVIAPGLGGAGSLGAIRTGADGSGLTVPLAPTAGQATTVGSLGSAFPGAAGRADPSTAPSNRCGSSGGGTQSAGIQATSTTGVLGGNPGSPAANANGEGGAGVPNFSSVGNGACNAEHGGASTTASGTATTNFQPGGTSLYGGSAGGWGAGCNTATSAATNGGAGGGVTGGGTPGVSAVSNNTNATGTNGGNGADGTMFRGAAGGAGGGSAKIGNVDNLVVVTAQAGNGGDGGFPAGGAGGGGDAILGIVGAPLAASSARAGNGGKGGDGLVLLTITS